MKKWLISIFLVLFCSRALALQESNHEDDLEEIKQRSSIWNDTFITQNVDNLLAILSKDVQMASAGGKWNTKMGTEKFLYSLFQRRPDVTWINNPTEIIINPQWEVAYEDGTWIESWTEPDGQVTIKGKYSSLWKKENSTWVLHAMVFIPLNCIGDSKYCESSTTGKNDKILNRGDDTKKDKKLKFTQTNSDEIMKLEKDIAFFYGAKDPVVR